jgi:hypothetical protein
MNKKLVFGIAMLFVLALSMVYSAEAVFTPQPVIQTGRWFCLLDDDAVDGCKWFEAGHFYQYPPFHPPIIRLP